MELVMILVRLLGEGLPGEERGKAGGGVLGERSREDGELLSIFI